MADLVDVTRLHTADPGNRVPHLAFQPDAMSDTPILPIEQVSTSYYLRLRVDDQPGVLADIARILADRSISIGSMIQQPSHIGGADIIFLTHEAVEGNVNQAIERIEPCRSCAPRSPACAWKTWSKVNPPPRRHGRLPLKGARWRTGKADSAAPRKANAATRGDGGLVECSI